MSLLTLLSIGFSIISALILFGAYTIFLKNVNKSWFAILSCAGLLTCLIFLQLGHLDFVVNDTDVLLTDKYRLWLYIAPVMFFFFSRATLLPDARVSLLLLLHFILPLGLYFLVPPPIAVPVTFLIGMIYSFWLANLILGLKAQRSRFKYEIFFFVFFAVTAVLILIVGMSVAYIGNHYFYYIYANSIGVAFILIVSALIVFPELLNDLAEIAKVSYAASTLKGIDTEASLEKLDHLMTQARMYQNENLSLAILAHEMGLSGHQLSEIINVQFGVNFSRYIREQRVAAAKVLLVNEPESSVLAIGLETGFKSQSNFYAAFKEITGVSPGSYRKSEL